MANLRGRSDEMMKGGESGKMPMKPPTSDKRPHMAGSPPPDVTREKAQAEVVEADAQVGDQQMEQLGKDAPQPQRPLPMSVVKNFVKALNDATAFLSDGKIPPIGPDMPEQADAWNKPLPAQIYAMTKIMIQAIKMADAGGKFTSMMYDPVAAASTPEGMRDATGKLMLMSRSADLKAAVSRPPSEVGPAGQPPAAPEPEAPPAPAGGQPPADEVAQPVV